MPTVSFGLFFATKGEHNSKWLEKCMPPHMVDTLHYQFVHGPRSANKKALKFNSSYWLSKIQAKPIGKADYFQDNTKME